MKTRSLTDLSDQELLRSLAAAIARARGVAAEVLAHVAEVDRRKLYVPAGHPSMFSYCVHVLHLSEDVAFKRIQAARAARRFPAILDAVAEGRLHLSAVTLLVPHLTEATATELLQAAVHKTKAEIEQLLAERFPRPDLPTLVQALPTASPVGRMASPVAALDGQPAPGHASASSDQLVPGPIGTPDQLAPGQVDTRGSTQVAAAIPPAKVAPLAPERFGLQVTIDQSTLDKLHHAQALLSHQIPSGDVAQVLDRALDALVRELEKTKFAATPKPRTGHRASRADSRHIPAEVKRAVWERDSAQCTFVSDTGHRCGARKFLEFDHVDPFARGGQAIVSGIRLRCRAHNQYEAERLFGAGFMHDKREARRAATARKAARAATARARADAETKPSAKASDVAGRDLGTAA